MSINDGTLKQVLPLLVPLEDNSPKHEGVTKAESEEPEWNAFHRDPHATIILESDDDVLFRAHSYCLQVARYLSTCTCMTT